MFLTGVSLSFHYVPGVYIFITYLLKLSLMPGRIPAINLPEKCIIKMYFDS